MALVQLHCTVVREGTDRGMGKFVGLVNFGSNSECWVFLIGSELDRQLTLPVSAEQVHLSVLVG